MKKENSLHDLKAYLILLHLLVFVFTACTSESAKPKNADTDPLLFDVQILEKKLKEGSDSFLDSISTACQQKLDSFEIVNIEKGSQYLIQLINAALIIGQRYLDISKTEKALPVFESALDMASALGDSHPVIGDCNYWIGKYYYSVGKFKDATIKISQSLNLYKLYGDEYLGKISNCTLALGEVDYLQGQHGEAIKKFRKSLAIRLPLFGVKSLEVAECYNNLGLTLSETDKFDSSLHYLRQAVSIRKRLLGKNHFSTAESQSNLGGTLFKLGAHDRALTYFRNVLPILRSQLGENHLNVALTHNNIGICYYSMGDYEKSINHYEVALSILTPILGDKHPYISLLYNNIGSCLAKQKKYDLALDKFLKSLEIREKLNNGQALVAESYNNIGETYNYKMEFDKALNFHRLALNIKLGVPIPNKQSIADSYNNIGSVFHSKKNYPKSLKNHLIALGLRDSVFGENHPAVAQSLNNIGAIYGEQKMMDKALYYYHQAALSLLQDFSSTDVALVPEQKGNSLDDIALLEMIYNKAKVFKEEFEEYPDSVEYLEFSLNHLKGGIRLIEKIQKKLVRSGSKFLLFENAFPIYEDAISLLFKIENNYNKSQQPESMFEFFEKGKSILLKENIQNLYAKKYAKIPESIVQKESDLQNQLTYFEKLLNESTQKKEILDSLSIISLQVKISRTYQSLDSLIHQMETQYPTYHNLKYNTNTVSAKYIQDTLLLPHQSLLEYFTGDSTIFLFLITKDTFHTAQVKRNFPLKKWVEQMRKGIYEPYTAQADKKESAQQYASAAHKLYNKIFKPIAHLLPKNGDLIIVPDGELGYIPFDALLKKMPDEPENFNNPNYPYLMKDHTISLAYSATLLKEMRARQHSKNPKKSLIAFAPSFPNNGAYMADAGLHSNFDTLWNNVQEVEAICRVTKADAMLGPTATKANFLERVPEYQIVHLSTHAQANDQTGDYALIAFSESKDSTDSPLLYNSELYNLGLNADMVVLSACETGIGELQRGEGIISLARGFSYAGAKSIVTSLWKVSEGHTSHLMKYFYQKIKEGMPKDQALRAAKMEYLENSFLDNSPFYWAGFFAIGDMSPIQLPPPTPLWQWLLGGILCSVLIRIATLKFYRK